eukprot:TRINITY_DN59975_c0_g1_i1.p1 TRINITY_DN59975_c0_g1~~TRINITY_DN59975_c0_g1_i1.p1  ORF type:complete len:706 (-),score=48.52 TRINITY_DN59975_c0_g1_i1:32-2149(-)
MIMRCCRTASALYRKFPIKLYSLLFCVLSITCVAGITYPGGIVEPCLSPDVDPCYETRCVHLYTVPEQYQCLSNTYPRFDYDPTGPQCRRPICRCAEGYTGGHCYPHVQHACLQHSCQRHNATSHSPTHMHRDQYTIITINGVGLDERPYPVGDYARIIHDLSCIKTENDTSFYNDTAPGAESNYTNMGLVHTDNHHDLTETQFMITISYPGTYTVCYKPAKWEEAAVDPGRLTVAGITGFETEEKDYFVDNAQKGRAGDTVNITLLGFGFGWHDEVKLITATDEITWMDAANITYALNTSCEVAIAYSGFTGVPWPDIDSMSPLDPEPTRAAIQFYFPVADNYTICYKAEGGGWFSGGTLAIVDAPRFYDIDSTNPDGGGNILRTIFNITFFDHGNADSGDIVELRRTVPHVNLITGAVSYEPPICNGSEPYEVRTDPGDLVLWGGNVFWETPKFRDPINYTVCYWSTRAQTWFEIPPREERDELLIRRLYYQGFDNDVYGGEYCYPSAFTTVSGPEPPTCMPLGPTDVPIINLHSFQNNSLLMPPGSGIHLETPNMSPIKPDKIHLWVKPHCAGSPSLRLRITDFLHATLGEWHLGCPHISVNHEATEKDWAMGNTDDDGNFWPAVAWHKLTLQFFWELEQYYIFWDDERVESADSSLWDFLDDPYHGTITHFYIENDSETCNIQIDEIQAFYCFNQQCLGED